MAIRCFILIALLATGSLHAQNAELIQANQQKLYSIILPDLNFQNVPVAIALKRLHTLANASRDPARRVNFAYQAASFGSKTVTVVLYRPSLNRALDVIAEQAQLQIYPQEFCIAILPKPPRPPAPPAQ